MTEKDYSHVPLWKKLGVAEGARVAVLHPPEGVAALADFPEGSNRAAAGTDVFITFHTKQAALEKEFPRLVQSLAERGGLWVAYPKQTSKLQHELDFDFVQKVGLRTGLVDNKICRIDDDWTAMRFVRRRK